MKFSFTLGKKIAKKFNLQYWKIGSAPKMKTKKKKLCLTNKEIGRPVDCNPKNWRERVPNFGLNSKFRPIFRNRRGPKFLALLEFQCKSWFALFAIFATSIGIPSDPNSKDRKFLAQHWSQWKSWFAPFATSIGIRSSPHSNSKDTLMEKTEIHSNFTIFTIFFWFETDLKTFDGSRKKRILQLLRFGGGMNFEPIGGFSDHFLYDRIDVLDPKNFSIFFKTPPPNQRIYRHRRRTNSSVAAILKPKNKFEFQKKFRISKFFLFLLLVVRKN